MDVVIKICKLTMHLTVKRPLDPLLPSDSGHQVLDEVLLPGAAGPVEVLSAPDEVDDGREARAAEDAQVHGQMEVVSPQQDPQHVTQHIDTPGK